MLSTASLVLFLNVALVVEARDCKKIEIVSEIYPKGKSYEDCTHASQVVIQGTHNLHLKLPNLEVIEQRKTVERTKYYENLIWIHHNVNFTFDHETMPKLKKIVQLEESKSKAYAVRLQHNYPFSYSKQLEKQFLSTGLTKDQIRVTEENSCLIDFDLDASFVLNSDKVFGNENCTTLVGPVKITKDFKLDSPLAKRLRSTKVIYGNVLIDGSNLTDLSIFDNVEKIDCEGIRYCKKHVITITNNLHLTGFFRSLSSVRTNTSKFYFANNSNWARQQEYLEGLDLSHEYSCRDDAKRTCKFEHTSVTMTSFTEMRGCSVIEGDLLINENADLEDKLLKTRLHEIREIHGCLTIAILEVERLHFLISLELVDCKKKRDAVIIRNNTNLRNVELQLSTIHAHPGFKHIVMRDNDMLCQQYEQHFTHYLLAVDGPLRILIQPELKFCTWHRESSGWPFLAAALAILLPALFWGSVALFKAQRAKPRRRNRVPSM